MSRSFTDLYGSSSQLYVDVPADSDTLHPRRQSSPANVSSRASQFARSTSGKIAPAERYLRKQKASVVGQRSRVCSLSEFNLESGADEGLNGLACEMSVMDETEAAAADVMSCDLLSRSSCDLLQPQRRQSCNIGNECCGKSLLSSHFPLLPRRSFHSKPLSTSSFIT